MPFILALDLKDCLLQSCRSDGWCMTVFRKIYNHLTRLDIIISLWSLTIECNVIGLVVWSLVQRRQRRPAVFFCSTDRNLYIYHSAMAFQFGILTRFRLCLLDVDEQVVTDNLMDSGRQTIEIILFDKFNYLCKQRIQTSIFTNIF